MPDFTPIGPADTPLHTLAQRVWFAWHCLPRGKDMAPPSWRRLEMAEQLPNGVFSKILSGHRQTVEAQTFRKLARALQVPFLWLLSGEEPPDLQTTGPFTVLGATERDPEELDRRVRSYLRRCGFDEDRIEQASHLLLATPEEHRTPFGTMTNAAATELTKALRTTSEDLAPKKAAIETLQALSTGDAEGAHRAARKLARRVLSTGLPQHALAVLTDSPTWSASAFRLAEAHLSEGRSDRPSTKRPPSK